jgi:chromosome segregation ATPase
LAGLRPVSSELQQQLHQSVLDLERAKADFQQQLQERQRAETELCEQLDAAKAAGELSAIDLKEKVGRCGLLEEALTGVRQVRDDLLQQQRRNEADLERVRTELQQLSQERQQVEAELCEQLDAAKAAADQNANALKDKAGRCARLEEELAGLRQVREELDRERQRGAADLERAEADLQLQSLERQQVERELRQQLDTASAEAEQSVIALKESESRCARLEEDLRKLRQTRDEFQLQHGQSATELQRAKAELQRETEARLRLEFQNRALAEEKEALNQELSLLRESQSARTVKPITKQSPAGESTEAAAQGNSAPEPTGNQSFRLTAPKAAEVLLAGDFTDWKKRAIPMHKDNDGRWTASVKLAPGTYNYLFIVDNQWRSDPESTLQVANQFGGLNSVRKVV